MIGRFNNSPFKNNELLPLDLTQKRLWIAYPKAKPSTYYTMMIIDESAPSPEAPYLSPYFHFIKANIPGSSLAKGHYVEDLEGDTLLVYAPPSPPEEGGTHNYIVGIFPQAAAKKPPRTYTQRVRFDAIDIIKLYGLPYAPVATITFLTKPNGTTHKMNLF